MEYPSLDKPTAGAIRFNTDSSQLEIYDGNRWTGVLSGLTPTMQTGGTRALIGAGYDGSAYIKNIDYFNVDTTGNGADFGDLQNICGWIGALADRTRGIFLGDGNGGGGEDNTSYVTIASTGDAATFGNLTQSRNYFSGLADRTRGIRGGGYTSPNVAVNEIDYCTVQSTGHWKDFGDLLGASTTGKLTYGSGISSPTRGMWGGGSYYNPGATVVNNIDYITISTLGNSADFGDLTQGRKAVGGCANAVRGIWSGGYTPTYVNTMDYVTLATLGNAKDFGDSTWTGSYKSGASSPTRGTWSGGRIPAGRENRIDYTQIMTTGNAIDFGDLASMHDGAGGCSNGHGGL